MRRSAAERSAGWSCWLRTLRRRGGGIPSPLSSIVLIECTSLESLLLRRGGRSMVKRPRMLGGKATERVRSFLEDRSSPILLTKAWEGRARWSCGRMG